MCEEKSQNKGNWRHLHGHPLGGILQRSWGTGNIDTKIESFNLIICSVSCVELRLKKNPFIDNE